MDFKIINERAAAFGDSILPMDRQQELSKQLDDMVIGYGTKLQFVRVCHIMQEIALFCNTQEEFAYCIILHMGWHQKRGHQLC